MILSYDWQNYLRKSTEFQTVTHSLLQFRKMLQSKCMQYTYIFTIAFFTTFVQQIGRAIVMMSLTSIFKGKQGDFKAPSTIMTII